MELIYEALKWWHFLILNRFLCNRSRLRCYRQLRLRWYTLVSSMSLSTALRSCVSLVVSRPSQSVSFKADALSCWARSSFPQTHSSDEDILGHHLLLLLPLLLLVHHCWTGTSRRQRRPMATSRWRGKINRKIHEKINWGKFLVGKYSSNVRKVS